MKKSWIYVVGTNTKPYKIGLSTRPKSRLKDIQTGHPEKLSIHYLHEINKDEVTLIEKMIHKNINYKRTHGEWFNVELEEAIQEIKYAVIRYSKDYQINEHLNDKESFLSQMVEALEE